MTTALKVEVWFDFVCPWCLIGKRQLQRAIQQLKELRPDVTVQVEWHGVSLLPDLPVEGVPFETFYRQRLGGDAAVAQRQKQVQDAGAAVGLHFNFAAIKRMPNTALAHHSFRRLQANQPAERLEAVLESWFKHYFNDGGDLTDADALADLARAADVPEPLLPTGLAPRAFRFAVAEGGVPSFRFNGRHRVTGAVPATTLLTVMQAALLESAAPTDTH